MIPAWWWVALALAVVLTEALAEILSEGVIFESLKARLFDPPVKEGEEPTGTLLGFLARCGFCQSVWLGWVLAFAFSLKLPNLPPPWPIWTNWPDWVQCLVMGAVVHSGAVVWHDVKGVIRHLSHRLRA